MKGQSIVLSLGVILGASTFAAPQQTIEPDQYVICKSKGIVRTIRTEVTDEGGCQTKYTKAGVDRVIGYGKNKNSCSRFLDNVRQNLIDASWSCRELSDSKITADRSPSE